MTSSNPQQRQLTLFLKLSTEVRPPEMVQRDDRILAMTCSFEEIAESEEEVQLPKRTSLDGRSPFAVTFDSTFAERHGTSPQNLRLAFMRKLAVPRLCRGFSDPCLRRRQTATTFSHLSPDRHDAVSALSTIPETASS